MAALLFATAVARADDAPPPAEPAPLPSTEPATPAPPEVPEQMPGVRLSLSPGLVRTFTSRSISRDAVALAVDLHVSRRVAFGVSGAYFKPFDLNYDHTTSAWPLEQTLAMASVDVKGVVIDARTIGKGAQLYLCGGIGAVATRPVSVIDRFRRQFDYVPRVAFTTGVGGRFFLSRSLAVFAEVRDTVYVDAQENESSYATGADPATWYSAEKPLRDAFGAQLGLTLYLL